MFRYVLMLFPCFIAAAMLLKRVWLLVPYVVLGIGWHASLLYHVLHWHWVA
jgi:hypothetical protein